MAEYIEREKVALKLKDMANASVKLYPGIMTAYHQIVAVPAADVRPVVHGKWIEIPGTRIDVLADFRCSVCEGRMCMSSDVDLGWCGRCGAKMDGKDGKNG